MNKSVFKVAIFHHDAEIVGRVTRLASGCGLEIVRARSLAALAREMGDPLLSSVVIDLASPRDGGFEMLEPLCKPGTKAAIIVIGALDGKTAEATAGLAASKGVEIAVFHKEDSDERSLARELCAGRDRAPRFGPKDLDDCIENGNFRVEYQPKVPLLNPSATSQFGVEALCRMTHPSFGVISPDQFIPQAEKCGLIAKLTNAVAVEAFRAWRSWRQAELSLRLAINVSPDLLRDGEWSESFLKICAGSTIDPKWITLEITESCAGATDPKALEILTALRYKGFTLSIDDFGTGFSSLSNLYRLPVSELKIDKSFILDLQKSAQARTLVESTISMAQRIGLKIVAEGVETEALFRELSQMGCHEAQGYFIGKALKEADVVPFFTGWKDRMHEPRSQHTPGALPKIAILQALLNDIASDRTEMANRPPGWGGGRGRPAGEHGADLGELTRKIPPLVLGGDTLQALSLCHSAARLMGKSADGEDRRAKIGQLQALLEQELATTSDLEVENVYGLTRLLPRKSVNLGRPTPSATVDIPIRCRWLSPGDKNLRVFFDGAQWHVEDRGSAHGHFIDGNRLPIRRPHALIVTETAVDIGLASGSIAPLSLLFRRPSGSANAVSIRFLYDPESLKAEIRKEEWPSLERELMSTWIVFDGHVSAGRSPDCGLMLDDCNLPRAATIRFRNGFWIVPAPETSIVIGDAEFHQEAPLPPRSEVRLGGTQLEVRELRRDDPPSLSRSGSPQMRAAQGG
jgi:EAL domain-containing protein (putative c-di-GMP-specific phosphodiesterase class I)